MACVLKLCLFQIEIAGFINTCCHYFQVFPNLFYTSYLLHGVKWNPDQNCLPYCGFLILLGQKQHNAGELTFELLTPMQCTHIWSPDWWQIVENCLKLLTVNGCVFQDNTLAHRVMIWNFTPPVLKTAYPKISSHDINRWCARFFFSFVLQWPSSLYTP